MVSIKELRIGNHVLWNGERVKVDEISIGGAVGLIRQDGSDWFGYDAFRLEPIPITEELLTELGFEKEYDLHFDYVKKFENELSLFITLHSNGCMRIEVWDNTKHRGNMICHYLHELETFVFMTTKKELFD